MIAGVGALGRAVLSYGGFANYGIEIVAAFDSDDAKIGTAVAGKPVFDILDAKREVRRLKAELAVVCVPAQYAQKVSDLLIESGVKAILNFAPVLIKAPDGIVVRHIDVAANLAILSSMI